MLSLCLIKDKMDRQTKIRLCIIIYVIMICLLMIVCGYFMKNLMDEVSGFLIYPTGFMNEVAVEWQTLPLVGLVATNDTFCPQEAP